MPDASPAVGALPADPTRTLCPICGASNQCVIAETGRDDIPCWCREVEIPPAALARVPLDAIDRTCICPRCATGLPSPSDTLPPH